MATRLLNSGFDITVCDLNEKVLNDFQKLGANTTSEPAVCADHDMVIIIVATDEQVKNCLLGESGVINAVNTESPPLLAVMSTVLPETIYGVEPYCTEKSIRLVDAPVSGFPTKAREGTLSILAGGEASDVENMKPAFEVLAGNIYHIGALGTGSITKILNNMLGVTNMFLHAEAISIALKYDMDPVELGNIMEMSSGRNFMSADWSRSLEIYKLFSKNKEMSKVVLDLSRKDLEHASALSENTKQDNLLLEYLVKALNVISYDRLIKNGSH